MSITKLHLLFACTVTTQSCTKANHNYIINLQSACTPFTYLYPLAIINVKTWSPAFSIVVGGLVLLTLVFFLCENSKNRDEVRKQLFYKTTTLALSVASYVTPTIAIFYPRLGLIWAVYAISVTNFLVFLDYIVFICKKTNISSPAITTLSCIIASLVLIALIPSLNLIKPCLNITLLVTLFLNIIYCLLTAILCWLCSEAGAGGRETEGESTVMLHSQFLAEEGLRARIAELEEQLGQRDAQIVGSLDSGSATQLFQDEAMKRAIEGKDAELKKHQEEIARLKQEQTANTSRLMTEKGGLQTRLQTTIDEQNAKIGLLTSINNVQLEAITEKDKLFREMQHENARYNVEIEELKTQLSQKRSIESQLYTEKRKVEAEISRLGRQIEELTSQKEGIESQNADLASKLEAAKKDQVYHSQEIVDRDRIIEDFKKKERELGESIVKRIEDYHATRRVSGTSRHARTSGRLLEQGQGAGSAGLPHRIERSATLESASSDQGLGGGKAHIMDMTELRSRHEIAIRILREKQAAAQSPDSQP